MGRTVVTLTVAVVVVVMCAQVALAQPTVLLRYQWNEGDTTTWLVDTESTGEVVTRDLTADPPGRTVAELTSLTTVSQLQTVEAVDADGNGTVATAMGAIEIDVTIPPMDTQHMTMAMVDGELVVTGMGSADGVPEVFKAVLGNPYRHVISPRGELLETVLPFDIDELARFGPTAALKALHAQHRQSVVLPEEEIGVGYCWAPQQDLAPEGSELPPMTQTGICRLAGFEDVGGVECARLDMMVVMDITEPVELPVVGPIQEGTMAMGPAHFSMVSTVWFDNAAGRIEKVETEMIMDMVQESAGTLTIEGEEHPFHVQVEMSGFAIYATVVRVEEG